MTYLLSLKVSQQQERLKEYFKLKPPCVIITRGLPVTSYFLQLAEEDNVSILRTNEKTTDFISSLSSYFQKKIA